MTTIMMAMMVIPKSIHQLWAHLCKLLLWSGKTKVLVVCYHPGRCFCYCYCYLTHMVIFWSSSILLSMSSLSLHLSQNDDHLSGSVQRDMASALQRFPPTNPTLPDNVLMIVMIMIMSVVMMMVMIRLIPHCLMTMMKMIVMVMILIHCYRWSDLERPFFDTVPLGWVKI